MHNEDAEVHLQLAVDAAHMAVWESDIHGGQIEDGDIKWSAQGAALLGFPPVSFKHSFREFLTCVHADDRARVHAILRHAVDEIEDYELEYQVIWPDSSTHWLAAKACVFAGDQGHAARTLGIIWDITARKNTEERLQLSLDAARMAVWESDLKSGEVSWAEQKKLAEVTLNSIGDGVITTDAQGRTQYLNRVAEELTGWTSSMAQGQPIDRIFKVVDESSGEIIENVAMKCLHLAQSVGMSLKGVLIARDGCQVPVQDSAAPIRSTDGRILGTVVVFHDVSHERRLRHELSWQASHDALTGLINRREFEMQVAAVLASAKIDHSNHALLFLDLDQFKIVNDTCGHVAGDEFLRQLTALLQEKMRESDLLARLGGDEFGVLLRNCPVEQAHYLGDYLRQVVKDFRFVSDNHAFEIGASIGLAEINENSKSLTDILSAADRACYVAKEQGRNRVHFYQESDVVIVRRHGEMLWVSRLNEALEHHRFKLYSQSIMSLNGEQEEHAEILIRMMDEHDELVLPGAFIPAAERYDLMPAIDRWVIETLFSHIDRKHTLSRTAQAPDRVPCYAVNLSGISLNDDLLLGFISKQFEKYAISPTQICFEITETAAIGNLAKAKHFMEEVKRMGCRFSLDDFGSGLSSFAYLKNLPVDFLKIDGSFIKDIATDAIDCAMVAAINQVGHVMGIKTIAEWVENDLILAKVQDIGIDYAQGYAVGRLQPLM